MFRLHRLLHFGVEDRLLIRRLVSDMLLLEVVIFPDGFLPSCKLGATATCVDCIIRPREIDFQYPEH